MTSGSSASAELWGWRVAQRSSICAAVACLAAFRSSGGKGASETQWVLKEAGNDLDRADLRTGMRSTTGSPPLPPSLLTLPALSFGDDAIFRLRD